MLVSPSSVMTRNEQRRERWYSSTATESSQPVAYRPQQSLNLRCHPDDPTAANP